MSDDDCWSDDEIPNDFKLCNEKSVMYAICILKTFIQPFASLSFQQAKNSNIYSKYKY